MNAPVILNQATAVTVNDALAVDLTGAVVTFRFRASDGTGAQDFAAAATVVDAAAGTVSYTLTALQTAVLGNYVARWQVTFGDSSVRTFPEANDQSILADGLLYQYDPAADPLTPYRVSSVQNGVAVLGDPVAAPENLWAQFVIVPVPPPPVGTPLADCYEVIRAILGDHHPTEHRYADATLAGVLRSVVKLGKVDHGAARFAVTPDNAAITPALPDAVSLGLAVLHSARMLLRPDAASYSFGQRALRESFGDQYRFLNSLEHELFDLENPGGAMTTFQSFYGWVNATTGLNLYAAMTDMNTSGSVASVTIGRAGLQVSVV